MNNLIIKKENELVDTELIDEDFIRLNNFKPSPFVNTNLDFLFIPTIYATPSSTSLAL